MKLIHINAEMRKDPNNWSPVSWTAACCLIGGILCLFIFQLFIADINSKVAVLFSDSAGQQDELKLTSQPAVARMIYVAGFFLIMLASSFFMIKTWYKVGIGYKIALGLMQIWMAIHAISAYSSGPKPSLAEICGSRGPVTWIACGIVFIGISPIGWQLAKKVFLVLSNVAAAIVIAKITLSGNIFSNEYQAGRFFIGYIPLLMWTVPLLIYDTSIAGNSALIIFPLFVLYISAILSGNRSWIVVMALHTIIIFFKYGKTVLRRPGISYIILLVMVLLGWVVTEVYGEKIESVVSFLSDSWNEDTRTEQYRQFLSQVSFTDLLIGKGPRATWFYWGREYEGIDGYFTQLAFNGGFILLATYIILIVWPSLRLLQKHPSWQYATPAIVLVFWTLAMMGLSTFTGVKASYEHAVICILAGRCYYLSRSKSNLLSLDFNQRIIPRPSQHPAYRLA